MQTWHLINYSERNLSGTVFSAFSLINTKKYIETHRRCEHLATCQVISMFVSQHKKKKPVLSSADLFALAAQRRRGYRQEGFCSVSQLLPAPCLGCNLHSVASVPSGATIISDFFSGFPASILTFISHLRAAPGDSTASPGEEQSAMSRCVLQRVTHTWKNAACWERGL